MITRSCLILVLGLVASPSAPAAPILMALGNPDNAQFVNPSIDEIPAPMPSRII